MPVSTTGSKGTKVPYRCSFCGKSQEQVRKLIAGQGVYICDECINLCQEIIEEEMLESPRVKPQVAKLPNPRAIKIALDQYVICLLYTSDAADDLLCVDLGGRRIIKKKTQTPIPIYPHQRST